MLLCRWNVRAVYMGKRIASVSQPCIGWADSCVAYLPTPKQLLQTTAWNIMCSLALLVYYAIFQRMNCSRRSKCCPSPITTARASRRHKWLWFSEREEKSGIRRRLTFRTERGTNKLFLDFSVTSVTPSSIDPQNIASNSHFHRKVLSVEVAASERVSPLFLFTAPNKTCH